MEENIIISNPENFEKLKEVFKQGGKEKIHVLSDFDKTLTYAHVNGKKIPSLMAILRNGNYLSAEYARKAWELFNKYRPIEANPEIPLEEKKKAMHEWWKTHFALLIKYGLSKKDIEDVVKSSEVKFRDGALEFIDLLYKHNIPLAIISSSGLGKYAIELFFKRHNKLYDNIYIVSNEYVWDEQGKAIGIKEPIIHSMNKDETVLHEFPFYAKIEKRKNVILLTDIIEDIGMIKGFSYDNLLKIGFLNEDVDKLLDHYKKNFDVVITDDSPMNFVVDLIKEIL